MKSALPSDAKIMVDANAGYDYSDRTVDLYRRMDDIGLYCFEQPLRWNDFVFHAKLQKHLKAPVALDESLDDAYGVRQAIEIGACRAGNIKVSRVGGFREAIRMEETFEQANIPAWVGGMIESPVGLHGNLVFATRSGCSLPIDCIDREPLVAGFFDMFETGLYRVEGDRLFVSTEKPGMGLELNEKVLFAHQVDMKTWR